MANPDHVAKLKEGKHAWNLWRTQVPGTPDLSGADLSGMDLAGMNFDGSNLVETNFEKAKLKGAMLRDADCSRGRFYFADLSSAFCSRAQFIAAAMQGVAAPGTDFSFAKFEGADLREATLDGANMSRAIFSTGILAAIKPAKECQWEVEGVRILRPAARLDRAILDNAMFDGAMLVAVDLSGVGVNHKTSFAGADVRLAKFEKLQLEKMKDKGGLQAGQLLDTIIIDPVAELRYHYSGFWQWVHLLALLAFLAPYLVFLGKSYLKARFLPHSEESVTILSALCEYMYTGGTGQGPTWSFVAALFSIGYNVLRAVMLLKTKTLEHQQICTGLPAKFSLTGRWGTAFKVGKVLFWVNVAVVAMHGLHFLMQRIPAKSALLP